MVQKSRIYAPEQGNINKATKFKQRWETKPHDNGQNSMQENLLKTANAKKDLLNVNWRSHLYNDLSRRHIASWSTN